MPTSIARPANPVIAFAFFNSVLRALHLPAFRLRNTIAAGQIDRSLS
ncbi:hypothetical protein [Labrys sp. WJW]|nr:hypothetical protein [Labrys sp. WJW]